MCVYCGSSAGVRPAYRAAAERTAELLVAEGIGVVYGGGDVGLMGALADAALARGGEVIGIIPQALVDREVGHGGLTRMHVVGTMHERKALMADLSDAFIALPGGIGTLEELVEVLTWTQLGLHDKPCGLLDVEGYYAPLAAFLDHATTEGFVRRPHREMLSVAGDPADLLDLLRAWRPPGEPRWLDRASV